LLSCVLASLRLASTQLNKNSLVTYGFDALWAADKVVYGGADPRHEKDKK
jgi:hypothetical protein